MLTGTLVICQITTSSVEHATSGRMKEFASMVRLASLSTVRLESWVRIMAVSSSEIHCSIELKSLPFTAEMSVTDCVLHRAPA